jgi:putative SOS response-associated peptidase YedK
VPTLLQPAPDSGRQFRLLPWGLIPSWAEDPRIGNRPINARAETVATKPAFQVAFRKRRCRVLADGFSQWQRPDRRKQAFCIRLCVDRPFAFAGLWERWEGAGDRPIDSCTILTAIPNDLLRPLHHRMAVILPASAYDLWLNPSCQEPDVLQPLLRLYPSEDMRVHPVSTRVNNPANDSPECPEPLK